jgi:hypothetical protein
MAALEGCAAAALLDGTAPVPGAGDAWPPTVAGLEQLIGVGVMLAGLGRDEELEQLAEKLVVPEPRGFFASLLGEDNADLAEEEYGEEPTAAERFTELAGAEALSVTVERVKPGVGHTMQQVLLAVAPSVEVYNCRHHIAGSQESVVTRNWHHDGEHWRLLGELWALRRDPRGEDTWQKGVGYPGSGPHPFPGTPEGLATLVEWMLACVADDDTNKLRWLSDVLPLPDPEAWFHRVFEPSEELDALLADYVKKPNQVAGVRNDLARIERAGGWSVEVHTLVDPEPGSEMGPPRSGPMAMRDPVSVYAAEFVAPGGDRPGPGLLPMVYVDGGWRLLGTFMRLESAAAERWYEKLLIDSD